MSSQKNAIRVFLSRNPYPFGFPYRTLKTTDLITSEGAKLAGVVIEANFPLPPHNK